ncbi:MAG: hypothetical protein IJU66_05110 [Oscillospiraceae bacterium]|nr:hypothetical protein [Oscillospiraceae bacterium]
MKERLSRFACDQTGAMTIVFHAFLFALLMGALVIMEIGGTYERYDYVMDVLQRDVNSTVESYILDNYRADMKLALPGGRSARDAARVYVAVCELVEQDLIAHGYQVTISDYELTGASPSFTVSGTASFPTLFSHVGFGDVTFAFRVTSRAYDLDG